MPTVAIIGSFRQHLALVSEARQKLTEAGWAVVSPRSGNVDEPGISFVRFDTDDVELDEATVQAIALHRILQANMVYVCAPDGYVGRTTCLERPRVGSEPVATGILIPAQIIPWAEDDQR